MQEVPGRVGGRSAAADLQDLLVEHPGVWEFLQELAVFTSVTLSNEAPAHCGITLQRGAGDQLTVGSSSPEAKRMDEVQYQFDDGPCLHALRQHTEVQIPDVASENRWPDFMKHIAGNNVGAMFCLPLRLEGTARAALNLYVRDPATMTVQLKDIARGYAAQASQALKLSVRTAGYATMVEDLNSVLQSRTEIDLAIGIIMAQNRCTQAEAFDVLRKASNGRNVKLRVLANEIVGALNGTAPVAHFNRA
ncbi:GAF and ANTAR domain-containing protein [Arthrobacter sp. H5]|uniref:GAF and ANTAR domain-containing protein n=1 Tax=Arthrobacter sp. H5 TaxID=1267973 RepID=UPI000488BA01|nr:GAF and ANTAR domain-containing protein [Arthrobacter sp. H5]